jgi:hypothetical protein
MAKLTLKRKTLGLAGKKSGGTLKLGRKKLTLGKKKEQPVIVPTAKKAKKVAPPVAVEKKKKPSPPPVIEKKAKPPIESTTSKRKRLAKELNGFSVWRDKLPLQIGVLDDLFSRFNPAFSKKNIRFVVHQHSLGARYLKNVATGESRYSLLGEVTSEITPKEKQFSHKSLNKKGLALVSKKVA